MPTPGRIARAGQGREDARSRRTLSSPLDIARRRQANSRTARGHQPEAVVAAPGRCAGACHLLAEVYGWFTEGFDTDDLQEARRYSRSCHDPTTNPADCHRRARSGRTVRVAVITATPHSSPTIVVMPDTSSRHGCEAKHDAGMRIMSFSWALREQAIDAGTAATTILSAMSLAKPSRPRVSTASPASPATARRWSPTGAIAVVSAPPSQCALAMVVMTLPSEESVTNIQSHGRVECEYFHILRSKVDERIRCKSTVAPGHHSSDDITRMEPRTEAVSRPPSHIHWRLQRDQGCVARLGLSLYPIVPLYECIHGVGC